MDGGAVVVGGVALVLGVVLLITRRRVSAALVSDIRGEASKRRVAASWTLSSVVLVIIGIAALYSGLR